MSKTNLTILSVLFLLNLSGCAPEIGSDAWCQQLGEKAKGDWTLNETKDYARHCLFK